MRLKIGIDPPLGFDQMRMIPRHEFGISKPTALTLFPELFSSTLAVLKTAETLTRCQCKHPSDGCGKLLEKNFIHADANFLGFEF
jgi:hypothetical protein